MTDDASAIGSPTPVPACVLKQRQALRVVGPDALSWLNGVISCDCAALGAAGGTEPKGGYGLFLTRLGKVLADAWVVPVAEGALVVVPAEVGAALVEHLDRLLIMEDAELQLEAGWTFVVAAGAGMLGEGADGGAAHLPVLGAEGRLWAFRGDHASVWLEANASQLGLEVVTDEVWKAIRLERAFPEFLVDYDGSHYPHEASLERRAVAWSKGCYLGQEVVCRQDMRGKVRRSLILLDANAPVMRGDLLVSTDGDAEAGSITSAVSNGSRWLALAMVKVKHQVEGVAFSTGDVALTPHPGACD